MALGKRIKAAREACGKGQDEVAAAIGVSKQAVSNWERDLDEPKASNLLRLPAILGVTTEYLLYGEGAPDKPDEAAQLLAQFKGQQRRLALKLLKTLVEDTEETV